MIGRYVRLDSLEGVRVVRILDSDHALGLRQCLPPAITEHNTPPEWSPAWRSTPSHPPPNIVTRYSRPEISKVTDHLTAVPRGATAAQSETRAHITLAPQTAISSILEQINALAAWKSEQLALNSTTIFQSLPRHQD